VQEVRSYEQEDKNNDKRISFHIGRCQELKVGGYEG
jgi:hypothetical protein